MLIWSPSSARKGTVSLTEPSGLVRVTMPSAKCSSRMTTHESAQSMSGSARNVITVAVGSQTEGGSMGSHVCVVIAKLNDSGPGGGTGTDGVKQPPAAVAKATNTIAV